MNHLLFTNVLYSAGGKINQGKSRKYFEETCKEMSKIKYLPFGYHVYKETHYPVSLPTPSQVEIPRKKRNKACMTAILHACLRQPPKDRKTV